MRISDWSSDVCSSDLFSSRGSTRLAKSSRLWKEPCPSRSTTRISIAFSPTPFRSEEHTSELQSLMRISYAVFCLKKKKYTITPSKSNAISPQIIIYTPQHASLQRQHTSTYTKI